MEDDRRRLLDRRPASRRLLRTRLLRGLVRRPCRSGCGRSGCGRSGCRRSRRGGFRCRCFRCRCFRCSGTFCARLVIEHPVRSPSSPGSTEPHGDLVFSRDTRLGRAHPGVQVCCPGHTPVRRTCGRGVALARLRLTPGQPREPAPASQGRRGRHRHATGNGLGRSQPLGRPNTDPPATRPQPAPAGASPIA